MERLISSAGFRRFPARGFVLYYKRLEAGTFELPSPSETGLLSWQELLLMLEGVALESARYRKRFGG